MTTLSRPRRGVRSLSLTLLLGLSVSAHAAVFPAAPYREIATNVDEAIRVRPSDAKKSLELIDAAREVFARQIPIVGETPVVNGVKVALENARIAVGRSQTDLEAQAAQARGLLRKVMHDTALEALSKGDTGAVREIGALADDLGVRGDERAALVGAARQGKVDLVRARLERTLTERMQGALERVNLQERGQAYLEMARATSFFTVVQGSPRAGTLTTGAFVNVITAITKGETQGVQEQLDALRGAGAAFRQAAAQNAEAIGTGAPVPTPEPSTTPAPGTEPTPAPEPEQPEATPVPAQPAPASTSTASLDTLYAPVGRALVATGHGDNAAARTALAEAARLFAALPAEVRTTAEADALRADLDRLQNLGALRPADVRALLGRVANAEAAQSGRPVSGLDAASASATAVYGGPLRTALFVLLGLIALYPLYLLNLAFGGRNPYWRAIGIALLLFLAPVMLEGIASLGILLADLTGVGALGALANLSLLQGPVNQPVWALLVAIGLGLSIWGFRGICMQFGLLGGRAAPAEQSQQPAVEWDDEL